MTTVWLLVCDGARARTFETRDDARAWRPVKVVVREDSRTKATASMIENIGEHEGSVTVAPGEETDRFARSLLAMLDQALRARRFDRWVLVAPPAFVGVMKKSMSAPLAKQLLATVEKDLTHLDLQTLAERLRHVVQILPDEVPTVARRRRAN